MAHVTLYLDERLAEALACAAEREHMSKSAWVARLINERLDADDREARLEAILRLAGKWEDTRTAEQIVADVKSYPPQPGRPAFD